MFEDTPLSAFGQVLTTVTSTAAEKAYGIPASIAPLSVAFNPGELILQPGETLTFEVQNSGVQSTEVLLTIDFSEQF